VDAKMEKLFPSTPSDSTDSDKKRSLNDDRLFGARDVDEESDLLVRFFEDFELT
jgi:hypothetical protein